MLIDLQAAGEAPDLAAEVCIVGAGAAGITLARSLLAAGHRVCVLESGGLDYEPATQELYAGANLGMEYYPLDEARLRFFGGTTNIWGGRCVPLDRLDFERRPWVPHSGWPLSLENLLPYYGRAHEALGLGPFAYGDEVWAHLAEAPPAFDPERIGTRFWRFDERKERFGAGQCTDLIDSPAARVVLHANVVRLQADRDARAIEHVVVRALGGPEIRVSAKAYVLACGAIENARLLLASNNVEPTGIGNRFDQVGRYFMEHPHARAARIETDRPYALWALLRKRFVTGSPAVAPALVPAEKLQAERGILNSAFTFKLQRDPQRGPPLNKRIYFRLKHGLAPTRAGRRLWHAYRATRNWLQRRLREPVERARAGLGWTGLYVIVRGEQAPNPSSRVRLSQERDALEVPRADLDWQLGAQDKATVADFVAALDAELARLGLGRAHGADWLAEDRLHWPVDPTVSNHPIGGYHHLGTTRMSAAPRSGVVNADCRVHDRENLYIAGSSVFTTGGCANPTLTIMALSLRLGAHLHQRLRRPPAALDAE